LAVSSVFSFQRHVDLLDLHSFPTRRSSDLEGYSSIIWRTVTVLSQREFSFIRPWPKEKQSVTVKSWQPGAQQRNLVDSHSLLWRDRKSTRLNSSHVSISYAVFCLKKKMIKNRDVPTPADMRSQHSGALRIARRSGAGRRRMQIRQRPSQARTVRETPRRL